MLLEHAFGAVGAVLLLGAYWLGSTGRLSVRGALYQSMNLAAATILLIYSAVLGAWTNAVLNAIWAGVALTSLWRNRRQA